MIKEELKAGAGFMLALMAALLMCCGALLTSCRTQYVPVETVRTEYKTRDSIRFDSIYQRDSVYMQVKGDSVYLYKYKYLYRYLTINKTDTVIKTDSVQIPYPVEKQLSRWESVKMELGGWAFGVIIVMAIIIVGWLVYRCRNKK